MAEKPKQFSGVQKASSLSAYNALKNGKPGDSIPRAELTRLIGEDCGPHGAGMQTFYQARAKVLRETGSYWALDVETQCFKCLTEQEKVRIAEKGQIKRSRRAADKGMKIARSVRIDQLSPDDLREQTLNTAVLGLMAKTGSAVFRKRLLAAAEKPSDLAPPDVGSIVKLMASGGTKTPGS